jgi:CubicO group peptidase (beta-lactamase class C family)
MHRHPPLGQDLAQRIDAVADAAIDAGSIAGLSVLVAHRGQLVHRRDAGWFDREAGVPMRADAIFRLASLTKPIVSATAMAMIDRGVLALDDEIARWLPAFKPRSTDGGMPAITVRQLLTHTAGFDYAFQQPAEGSYHRARISDGMDASIDMDEQLRRIASVPLLFAPGEGWHYSVALDVLGEVLARAGDSSLPGLVAHYVTEPLDMRDTGFAVRDATRLAVPYADGAPAQRMGDPQQVPFFEGVAGFRFSPSRVHDPRAFVSGGAGMVGTAADFLRLLEAVRGGGAPILSTASAQAMMSNQIGALRIDVEPVPAWGFGFGGAVLMDAPLAATGQSPGTWKWGGVYGHHWFVDPVRDLTVLAMTNTAVGGMMGPFPDALLAAVYAD